MKKIILNAFVISLTILSLQATELPDQPDAPFPLTHSSADASPDKLLISTISTPKALEQFKLVPSIGPQAWLGTGAAVSIIIGLISLSFLSSEEEEETFEDLYNRSAKRSAKEEKGNGLKTFALISVGLTGIIGCIPLSFFTHKKRINRNNILKQNKSIKNDYQLVKSQYYSTKTKYVEALYDAHLKTA